MSPISSRDNDIARRGLLKISEATVLSAVDGLDLRAHAKISAVVGVPLRNLQQRHDVESFATGAPIAAVRALLELLAMSPLEKVIEALGDHADTPTFEQLESAIDTVTREGATLDDVVAVLTFAVAEEFPAAPHCRRLFDERAELTLPELPDVTFATSTVVPKATDPLIKEQRRRRREEEKKKRGPSAQRPSRPSRVKAVEKPPVRERTAPLSPEVAPSRRSITLTPSEQERFDADHGWAGDVIIVDVPFDATDPIVPEARSKERPALVVAVASDALLVRPIYSSASPSRSLFQAWRRLGLDHLSYIDDARVAVTSTASPERVGRLSDQEWNAQL